MAVVYLHKRGDNGDVFYVGIGKEEKRAYERKFRNKYWVNIVNKHGFSVEILFKNVSWKEACRLEIETISKYKRKIDGGTLCNITSGGDGVVGIHFTDEHKRKISESNKGKKRTIEQRKNISEGRNGIVFSESHKLNISKSKVGKKMSDSFRHARSVATKFGNHPKSKCVVDLETGIFYTSIKEACCRSCLIYTTEVQRIRRNDQKSRFKYI